jgi:putative membrane protein
MRKLRAAALLLAVGLLVPASVVIAEKKEEKKAEPKAVSNADFVFQASAAGLGEVNLSHLALNRAGRAEVKEFAQRMLLDHNKANEELLRLANAKGLKAAPRMDDEHLKAADRLAGLRGPDFDREYVAVMVKDHEAAVALFDAASNTVPDADLKAWAGKTLPTLRTHLDMARKLAAPGEKDKGLKDKDLKDKDLKDKDLKDKDLKDKDLKDKDLKDKDRPVEKDKKDR